MEFFFELVEEVEGILALAVHLVDEHDDGRLAHTANGHQLARLRLHTLGTVNDDDGRVNGSERAEGIFGKVLVTGSVKDIDLIVIIVEFHHRGGHGDSALLLDVHPVGCSCLAYLVALDSACHLNLSAEEQELLGERGLTGVRVRDDGESSPAFYFLVHYFCYFVILLFRYSGMSSLIQASSESSQ